MSNEVGTPQVPSGEYTTWPMLTDRSFSARHLPPANKSYTNLLPENAAFADGIHGDITMLFARQGSDIKEGRSSTLFMFFAQWFTDGILRVDPEDRRKNTSNHNIDLCQIYGRTEETTRLLRSNDIGKLKSQEIKGEEYFEYLGKMVDGEWKVKEEFENIPYLESQVFKDIKAGSAALGCEEKLYATGLKQGNSSIGYVAINTLFMREHNRICQELYKLHSSWDDERLFQTARMINTALLLKLVITDYINHIAGSNIFAFDPGFAEEQDWYRTPWIALEFDLLYRWHGLVPEKFKVGSEEIEFSGCLFNNEKFEDTGFSQIINAASQNKAGGISLQNVTKDLLHAEYNMIKMGRDFRLESYNAYRERFKLKRLESFKELTDDESLQTKLSALYKNIDKVEFIVGLFAEKPLVPETELFGDLMYKMVAYDAFTQIYTNPLLSKNVFTKDTFTQYGLDLIENTNTVQDLADRNNHSGAPMQVRFGNQ